MDFNLKCTWHECTAAIFQTAKLLAQHLQNHRQLHLTNQPAPNVAFQSSFDAAFPFKFHPYAISYKMAENQVRNQVCNGSVCVNGDVAHLLSLESKVKLNGLQFELHFTWLQLYFRQPNFWVNTCKIIDSCISPASPKCCISKFIRCSCPLSNFILMQLHTKLQEIKLQNTKYKATAS